MIDGNEGTIRHLAQVMQLEISADSGQPLFLDSTEQMLGLEHTEYYMSGQLVTEEKILKHFLRLHNRLEAVRRI